MAFISFISCRYLKLWLALLLIPVFLALTPFSLLLMHLHLLGVIFMFLKALTGLTKIFVTLSLAILLGLSLSATLTCNAQNWTSELNDKLNLYRTWIGSTPISYPIMIYESPDMPLNGDYYAVGDVTYRYYSDHVHVDCTYRAMSGSLSSTTGEYNFSGKDVYVRFKLTSTPSLSVDRIDSTILPGITVVEPYLSAYVIVGGYRYDMPLASAGTDDILVPLLCFGTNSDFSLFFNYSFDIFSSAGPLPVSQDLHYVVKAKVSYTTLQTSVFTCTLRDGTPSYAIADFLRVVGSGLHLDNLSIIDAINGVFSPGTDAPASIDDGVLSGASAKQSDLDNTITHYDLAFQGAMDSVVSIDDFYFGNFTDRLSSLSLLTSGFTIFSSAFTFFRLKLPEIYTVLLSLLVVALALYAIGYIWRD